jgi:hypothetical protein
MCQRLKQRMRPLPVWRLDKEKSESHAKESNIKFVSVEIREYTRELGTFSDLDYGLALGWGYEQRPAISVDQHEQETRKKQAPTSSQSTGSKRTAKMTSNRRRVGVTGADKDQKNNKKNNGVLLKPSKTSERKKILTSFGFSRREINQAEVDCRLHGLALTSKYRIIVRRTMQEIW